MWFHSSWLQRHRPCKVPWARCRDSGAAALRVGVGGRGRAGFLGVITFPYSSEMPPERKKKHFSLYFASSGSRHLKRQHGEKHSLAGLVWWVFVA